MASKDDQGRPVITTNVLGQPAQTYLCADLQQVRRQNGSYDFRLRETLQVVGNTTVIVKEIEVVGA